MRLPNLRSAASRSTGVSTRVPGLTFGSVSSLLSVALWAAFWILALLTLATLILFIVMAFVPMGPMGLTATSDDGGTSVPVPRAYILFGIGAFAGYFGGFTLILRHLRRIVNTLRIGDPFEPANTGRLRQIGIILAVVTGGAWLGQSLVSRLVRGAMEAPGLFDLVTPAFSVLVVFVLAEVFKEGARLRRESELTI